MPVIYQFYASTNVKSGSIILVEIQQFSGYPLVVFHRYGNGVVMSVTTDNTWLWAFAGHHFEIDDSHYRKFWSSMIRWLAYASNHSDLITVVTDKLSYYKYDNVRISSYIYNEYYEPINDAQIKALIQAPNGASYDLIFVLDGNGRYVADFRPVLDGNHKINISAQRKEIPIGKGSTEFIVQSIPLEMIDTQLNEKLLKEIAMVSGGHYYHISDFNKLNINDVFDTVVSIAEKTIWDNVYLFIIAIILLSAEWLLRKRKELI